jgi:hypothetical protein
MEKERKIEEISHVKNEKIERRRTNEQMQWTVMQDVKKRNNEFIFFFRYLSIVK